MSTVQVPKKELKRAWKHVKRVMPTRRKNPGAMGLLTIDLQDESFRVTGSNMDVDVQAELPATVRGNGTYAFSGKTFDKLLKVLPGDLVELEFTVEDPPEDKEFPEGVEPWGSGEVTITSESFQSEVELVSPQSAVEVEFTENYIGELPLDSMLTLLDRPQYAAATKDYQAVFRGIKFEFDPEHTRAVATDGFRLTYTQLPDVTGFEADAVVPARSAKDIVRILKRLKKETDDDTVALAFNEGGDKLYLKNGGYRIGAALMEGNFPDYERVIPSTYPVEIWVEGDELEDIVERVSVMAEKTANNRVDLYVNDGFLIVDAEGPQGRAEEGTEVEHVGEQEFSAAFNANYLQDALSEVEGKAHLKFSGRTSPTVIQSDEDETYFAMVVPLRTGEDARR